MLKLIDERLYVGWHSSTPRDVGTRARRYSRTPHIVDTNLAAACLSAVDQA